MHETASVLPHVLVLAGVLAAAPAGAAVPRPQPGVPQETPSSGEDVPVTIKELDVEDAIREFQDFRRRLGDFREEIGQGQDVARETAQILEDLRASAGPENDHNEQAILEAVTAYVDGVVAKQVELVDFLESQRYRIAYYANKMAAAVRPEDFAVLFGTVEQNEAAIEQRVRATDAARHRIADFVDQLPAQWFDRETFRTRRDIPADVRKELNTRLYRYQQEKNALELAKRRLQLVRSATRATTGATAAAPDVDADLLIGQMFGALDRIRLQMSMDMLFLEQLVGGYSQSVRTQDILEAFQSLVELQGDLQGPSPELAGILDWLEDSSTRRLTLGAASLSRPGLDLPRSSDLLQEAYEGARGDLRSPQTEPRR